MEGYETILPNFKFQDIMTNTILVWFFWSRSPTKCFTIKDSQ